MIQSFLVNNRNALTAVLLIVGAAWIVQTVCEEPIRIFSFSLPPIVSVLAALALCSAAAYLLAELDNAFALVRVSQRVVSTLLFVLLASVAHLHTLQPAHLCVLCAVLLFFPLFHGYQAPQLTVMPYLAGLVVGLASLVLSSALFLLIPLWIAQGMLRAFSFRGWVATVLGVLTPYVWVLTIAYCTDATDWLLIAAADWLRMLLPAFDSFSLRLIGPIGVALLLCLLGAIDIIRNSQGDRTRTRYQNYAVLLLALWAVLWLLVQPYLADRILPFLLTPTAILAAHFLTLSSGRVATILSAVALSLLMVVCVLNLVAPVILGG